jgi:plasmid stability protein
MVRTQILLSPAQLRALKVRAAREGRSMADLVREGVDLLLESDAREHLKRRSLDALGRFRSGHPDLGTAHDAHLADAFKP